MNVFKRKEVAPIPEREPTCEEVRQMHLDELKEQLRNCEAEIDSLAEKMRAFKLVHMVFLGGRVNFRCSDFTHAEQVRLQWESYLHDLTILQQKRNGLLSELSTLTVNERETVHVGGELKGVTPNVGSR